MAAPFTKSCTRVATPTDNQIKGLSKPVDLSLLLLDLKGSFGNATPSQGSSTPYGAGGTAPTSKRAGLDCTLKRGAADDLSQNGSLSSSSSLLYLSLSLSFRQGYVVSLSRFLSFVQAMEERQVPPSGRDCPARVGQTGWFTPHRFYRLGITRRTDLEPKKFA